MSTNKQRRDAARRQLEQQLQLRQDREAARKRRTLIATVAGTVVLALVIVIVVVVAMSGTKKKKTAANPGSSTPSAASAPSSPSAPSAPPSPARAATGPAVTFSGVTVKGAADLSGAPAVTANASTAPAKLEYKDLVVGKGNAASPASTVTVQYVGALYKDGTPFDSSWTRGQPAQFPLTGVVPGFTQGIGGTTGIPPMKVGGRRLMILPAALGYGAQANGAIPPNSPLVFVVDLKSIDK